MKLRWLVKNDRRVLQFRQEYHKVTTSGIVGMPYIEYGPWQDVPSVYPEDCEDPFNLVDERTIGEGTIDVP